MKVNFLVVLFFLFTAQMLLAAKVKAQDMTEIKINLGLHDATLKTALTKIGDASGFKMVFPTDVVEKYNHISVDKATRTVSKTLELVLQNTNLDFKQMQQSIVLFEKTGDSSSKLNIPLSVIPFAMPDKSVAIHVSDSTGKPLAGATVLIQGTTNGGQTDKNGNITLSNVGDNAVLFISYVGYLAQRINIGARSEVDVVLKVNENNLQEVAIYNTGYQTISPERAVGSYTHPNEQMYNDRVSNDVISKLEGITSGLVFNPPGITNQNGTSLSIRGRSTIFANDQPAIIVDNFPYDGDINNINPNDVESVTILKDAAAAAIWGVKAGNGVIVITTKKGKYNQPLKISLNANVTLAKRPNLFYDPNFLDANDFINVEDTLFNHGFYDGNIGDPNSPLSPVVNILAAERAGTISAADATQQINALRNIDVRNDESKYFYQNTFNPQTNLSLSGGSAKDAYYFSFGYDADPYSQTGGRVGNTYQRFTINTTNTYQPIKNLELTTGIDYTQTPTQQDNTLTELYTNGINTSYNTIYPYAQLADANGNPLAVTKDYSADYVAAAAANGFLNWQFVPLEELQNGWNLTKTTNNDIRLNAGLKYSIMKGLNAEVKYQYEKAFTNSATVYDQQSYYARNQINKFSIVNSSGVVTGYNIPIGNIQYANADNLTSNQVRGQLDYNNSFGKSDISAIAGVEVRAANTQSNGYTVYGYDPNSGSVPQAIDYTTDFSTNPMSYGNIPGIPTMGFGTNHFRSWYGNASYTYNGKYTLYASGRIDGSNYFGVNANQKNVPLWSVGGKWNISKESFYHLSFLPVLSLRATYGYNGNLNQNAAAVTTVFYPGNLSQYTNAPYAQINSIGNPDLQWEKIGMLNFGVDFATKNNILSGSIEYYHKNGNDMLGYAPFAPSAGITQLFGNYSNMAGRGVDVQLTSLNLRGSFQWTTTYLFSWATDEVTKYDVPTPLGSLVSTQYSIYPVVGKPVYGVYGYKWGGLDAAGNPQGYDSTGKLSENYSALTQPTKMSQLVYFGPARPTVFGGLNNRFAYRGFALAFNISYKFGYYFRKPSIDYYTLFRGWIGNSDFAQRWQQPGDENKTSVPSMIYPDNQARDLFYDYSSVLVEKGDNIRLQDISFSYDLGQKALHRLPFSSLQFYVYADNIGILWRANKDGIDPDYPTGGIPVPRSYSFGIKADF